MRDASPLRYPGGKWRVAPFFERFILLNKLKGCHYVEPYAGGASLALSLLFTNHVSEVHLNDLDPAVHAFWDAVLTQTREFIRLLHGTNVTTAEWHRQRHIYNKGRSAGKLALGFATFFLNRTNHSGIMNGGMIGGKAQTGDWKLNARFNRTELQRRIERIGAFRARIHLSCRDAVDFLSDRSVSGRHLVYLDPPYYQAGRELYLNAYRPLDHVEVRRCVRKIGSPWIVSYDDVPEIRRLYKGVKSRRLELLHTARTSKVGREVLFFGTGLRIPRQV